MAGGAGFNPAADVIAFSSKFLARTSVSSIIGLSLSKSSLHNLACSPVIALISATCFCSISAFSVSAPTILACELAWILFSSAVTFIILISSL